MKQTQPNTTANKHGMLYDLEDKVPAGQSVIYGVQYLVYFLAQRWRFHFAGNPRTPLSYY